MTLFVEDLSKKSAQKVNNPGGAQYNVVVEYSDYNKPQQHLNFVKSGALLYANHW